MKLPIPAVVVSWWDSFIGDGVIGIVWKTFLIVVFLVLLSVLVAAGPIGALIAGVFAFSLFSRKFRALITDLWNRNFHSI